MGVTVDSLALYFEGRTTWAAANQELTTDDAADDIMERIVRSATQTPRDREQLRERRRSRANRKSCTLHLIIIIIIVS